MINAKLCIYRRNILNCNDTIWSKHNIWVWIKHGSTLKPAVFMLVRHYNKHVHFALGASLFMPCMPIFSYSVWLLIVAAFSCRVQFCLLLVFFAKFLTMDIILFILTPGVLFLQFQSLLSPSARRFVCAVIIHSPYSWNKWALLHVVAVVWVCNKWKGVNINHHSRYLCPQCFLFFHNDVALTSDFNVFYWFYLFCCFIMTTQQCFWIYHPFIYLHS